MVCVYLWFKIPSERSLDASRPVRKLGECGNADVYCLLAMDFS
jgi:hypothetical protein